MRKLCVLVVAFALLVLSSFPNSEVLAKNHKKEKDSTSVEILNEDYSIQVDETGFIYPYKFTGSYEDEDGNLVHTKEVIEDFIVRDNGEVVVNGEVIARVRNSENSTDVTTNSICGYYIETRTISRTEKENNIFLNHHPSFSKWDKVDGYWFGHTSVSYTIGVSYYGDLSVSVTGPGSGTFILADSSRWSRPGIFGDVWSHYYYWEKKQTCSQQVVDSGYKTVYYTQNTYNKTVYQ